ncbi:MAG TPA: hypothetical protein PK507_03455, partial [bacterium]|nr:hypothetical protein [bacterium]
MANLNMSSVSSGHYPDMQTSVSSVPTNKVLLDNISNVYNYKDIIQFPMSFLRKYENIIKANLQDYKIDKSRFYRPEYVSWDLYGTTDLWYLILFVNDLKSPMELNFTDIKVPNSLYIMEIMNKLKTIDRVKSTHKDPIYIYQSLLKDINSPSEKIIQDENIFIPDPSIIWEDSIDEFKDTLFNIDFGKITRDRYYNIDNTDIYKESAVNFGFISSFDTNKVLSPSVNNKMLIYKSLKSNTKYYIFKRYAGLMNLTIKSNDDSFKYVYNKKIFENEKVEMTPTILTYDLREATLAPEYLKENLILNYEDEIYEPEVITNADGEECYGIVINGVKYEIFFDGTAYYIVLDENKKKNEKIIALLENKDYDAKGNQLNTYHSMNE